MVLLFTLAACTSPSPSAVAPNPTVEALEAQVASLRSEVQQLRATAVPPSVVPDEVNKSAPAEDREADIDATTEPQTRAFPTREPRPLTATDAAPCAIGQIKGNRNSRIYHVPGGGSYAQTRANVACFDTEADAQAAGYRRARNSVEAAGNGR